MAVGRRCCLRRLCDREPLRKVASAFTVDRRRGGRSPPLGVERSRRLIEEKSRGWHRRPPPGRCRCDIPGKSSVGASPCGGGRQAEGRVCVCCRRREDGRPQHALGVEPFRAGAAPRGCVPRRPPSVVGALYSSVSFPLNFALGRGSADNVFEVKD
jgi:hypothetical protein